MDVWNTCNTHNLPGNPGDGTYTPYQPSLHHRATPQHDAPDYTHLKGRPCHLFPGLAYSQNLSRRPVRKCPESSGNTCPSASIGAAKAPGNATSAVLSLLPCSPYPHHSDSPTDTYIYAAGQYLDSTEAALEKGPKIHQRRPGPVTWHGLLGSCVVSLGLAHCL